MKVKMLIAAALTSLLAVSLAFADNEPNGMAGSTTPDAMSSGNNAMNGTPPSETGSYPSGSTDSGSMDQGVSSDTATGDDDY